MIKNTFVILILMAVAAGLHAQTANEPDKNTLTPEQEAIQKRIAEYRQKLADKPNDIEFHRAYQNFMRQWGWLNELKEEYILKMNAEPQNPLYFYLYGRLTEGKELEDSFRKAMELEAKTPDPELRFWLYFGFGQFYLDSKKYKEALQYLEMASKLKPDSLDVRHQTALVYYEMDNIAEAMKLWDKILETNKDYFDAMLGKALIYKSRGMYDNAIKELEVILKKDNNYWKAYEPLIQCHYAKKDYEKGTKLINKFKGIKVDNIPPLIVVDIIPFNKGTFIVKYIIDAHQEEHYHDFYYFDLYNDIKKAPLIGYIYHFNPALKRELGRVDYNKSLDSPERYKIIEENTESSEYPYLLNKVLKTEEKISKSNNGK